jgi:hypothetical protein
VDGNKSVTVRCHYLATGTPIRLGQGTPANVVVTDDDGPT